jgi:hypothetical protein
MMNAIGIFINMVSCLILAYVRAQVDFQSQFGSAPHKLGSRLMQLFVLVTALLVFSAMFLADALRRLSKALKKDNKMVVNQKTMCLHVTALLMHTIVIVAVQYVTVYSFENP